MIFIFRIFYNLALLLKGNDPIESAKLYIIGVFVGFTVPVLSLSLFHLIGAGSFLVWILITFVYILFAIYLLRRLFLNRLAKRFLDLKLNEQPRYSAFLTIPFSILLIFGSILLGFFVIGLLR